MIEGVNARLVVTPQTLTLSQGDTSRLTTSVLDGPPGTPSAVTWMSTAPGVADVSAEGLVTARSSGVASIVATWSANPAKSAAAVVNVTGAGCIRSVSVTPASASLGVGGTFQLQALIGGGCGNVAQELTWSVSDTTIATISASGLLTGRRVGQTTALATLVANTNVRVAVPVTVVSTGLGLRSMDVSPRSLALASCEAGQLTTRIDAPPGVSTVSRYVSLDTMVAVVDGSGIVRARRGGQVDVIASSVVDPSFALPVAVTVRDALVLPVGIRGIETGEPPTVVAPDGVKGDVRVLVGVTPGVTLCGPPETVTLTLTRAARPDTIVGQATMPAAGWGASPAVLAFSIATGARDSRDGSRLFPNGAATLRLEARRSQDPWLRWSASTAITLVNP